MSDKTDTLLEAVKAQAANLEPAQFNFIMAQLDHYRWNEGRISDLEGELEASAKDEYRDLDQEGKLFRQRHQLVAEQGTLFSHIMRWLNGTAAQESEIDMFLNK
ncbi:MAG: hypothetical protein IJ092_06385 [Atopobiaceae bacterium]|nr:hypothetical protein [Atopobiaceae bacterium]